MKKLILILTSTLIENKMNRISTLFTLLLVSVFSLFSATVYGGTTYISYGGSTNYTINAGDSLIIKSGTYTGAISNWQSGPVILVEENATFSPSTFQYFLGSIIVYGTCNLPNLDGQTSSFKLINYNRTTVSGYINLQGGAQVTNLYGATITFNTKLSVNSTIIFNSGTFETKAGFYAGNSSVITNNNVFSSDGSIEFQNSQVTNNGKLYAKGKLSFWNSNNFTNNCRTTSEGTIEIGSGCTVLNTGLLWASNASNNSYIYNNGGTLIFGSNGYIKSVDFRNEGTIRGNGYMYFTGYTVANGGTIGQSGTTSDSLRVYDVTRSNPSQIFDYQSGTIYPNTKYVVFNAPDTVSLYGSCAAEAAPLPLAVKWNYFYVNNSNSVPVLTWSAETDAATNFRVERSYDGVNFTSISLVFAQSGVSQYQYSDRNVNTQVKIVYYRIRAIEANGSEKLSDTRPVRFSNTQGITVQVTPNPFTSQFSINYQSSTKETITIRVINMTGQVQASRTVTTGNGFNSITITEAAALAKGVYLVQLVNQQTVIASEKIVKQ